MVGPTSGSREESRDKSVKTWEELASWWDQRQTDAGDLWHRTLINPTVFQVLGSVTGLQVLELACGNGYLCRHLARQGAKVVGVDASAAMIERAKVREATEPLGVAYHVAYTAKLEMFRDASFDVVLCNMALFDIEDAAQTIRETSRVLRSGGRFVASLIHPCFDTGEASAWLIERAGLTTTVYRKVSRYREVFSYQNPWRGAEGTWYTIAYHRPLSWYVRAIRSAGLAVTAFEEPEPTEEFVTRSSEGPWIAQIPLHCVIEATRLRA